MLHNVQISPLIRANITKFLGHKLLSLVVRIQDFSGYVHLYNDFHTIMIHTIIMWIIQCSSLSE
jgi:hypothetical protein